MTHQGHGRFIFPGRRARLPPSLFILPRLRLARREPRSGLPRLGLMKHWTCSARRRAIAVAGFVARESLRAVPSKCLVQAAQRRQIVARRREHQVTAMRQSDPLPRTPHGQ